MSYGPTVLYPMAILWSYSCMSYCRIVLCPYSLMSYCLYVIQSYVASYSPRPTVIFSTVHVILASWVCSMYCLCFLSGSECLPKDVAQGKT